jgi:hypothetical protein
MPISRMDRNSGGKREGLAQSRDVFIDRHMAVLRALSARSPASFRIARHLEAEAFGPARG